MELSGVVPLWAEVYSGKGAGVSVAEVRGVEREGSIGLVSFAGPWAFGTEERLDGSGGHGGRFWQGTPTPECIEDQTVQCQCASLAKLKARILIL